MERETIVAAMTPLVKSAVIAIRISGKRSLDILNALCGRKNFEERKATLVKINTGEIYDDAIVVVYEAPRSYTGESMVELFCHGNPMIARKIIERSVKKGAALAERGEFSKRALFNGKIDLTKAEGIMDLTAATTARQARSAYLRESGELYKKTRELQDKLGETIAAMEAAVDYPEEDAERSYRDNCAVKIRELEEEVERMSFTYQAGKKLREGVKVVISGKPNVGKSTLFNKLVEKDAAIVTDIPGTTRDIVKDTYEYKGVLFEVSDTAGLRETDDPVEKIGVSRSEAAAAEADVEVRLIETRGDIEGRKDGRLYVQSKCDIASGNVGILSVSAKYDVNIGKLKKRIYEIADIGDREELTLASLRQYEAFVRAAESLNRAESALKNDPADCVLSELDAAYQSLGEVTGVKGSEEIIDTLFQKFCVGK